MMSTQMKVTDTAVDVLVLCNNHIIISKSWKHCYTLIVWPKKDINLNSIIFWG